MSFLIAMQVLGTALSVQSAMQKGNAENTAAQMDAQQQTMRLAQEKIISAQRANDRLAEFDSNLKVNEAFFAFLGRDSSDESFKAFQAQNKKTAFSDVRRSQHQSLLDQGQIRYAREQALFGGREAVRASRMEAMNSLASGLYNYNTTKVV